MGRVADRIGAADSVTQETQPRGLGRLHEHDVTSPQFLTEQIVCPVDIGDEHRLPVPRSLEPGGCVDVAGPLAHYIELADVESHGESSDPVVLLGRVLPQFGHLTEHRDGTLAGGDDLRERLERGGRRVRARVVRVIDHDDAVAGIEQLHPPAFGSGDGLDRGDRPLDRDAELSRHGDRGKRVGDVVLAQNAQPHVVPLTVDGEGEPRAGGCRMKLLGAHLRAGTEAEEHDPGDCLIGHDRDAGIVGVEHGDGLRRQFGDHLGLGALRRLDAAELAGVGEAHLENDADIRRRDRHQAGDLTDAARPHLDDEVPRRLVDPQHRDRRADLIVERALGSNRRALALENGAQKILGGRLAVGTRDADHPEGAELANSSDDQPGQCGQSDEPIRDDELGRGHLELAFDDDEAGAVGDRLGREQVPVGDFAGQREEDRAGADQPGVGLHAAGDFQVGTDARGQHETPAEHLLEFGEAERDHAQPASRRAARASSRAEYGVRTPSMSR